MSKVWLDVHYRDGGFDVLIDDTDRTSLMDLYEFMCEDSVKQNVILPKYFALLVNKPRTNRKLELCADADMLKMWEWNMGKETIDVWLEERESPGLVFKEAEACRQRRIEQKAELDRLEKEKKKRLAEEEEAQRELAEQEGYTVAVEVPVVDAEDSGIEYVRVFNTPVADEVFPGPSQPQAEQSSQAEKNTEPSNPSKQSQPTSPLNQPRTKTVRKKMTPKKRKTKEKPPQPEPPQPEPQPETHPETAPPETPQPETAPTETPQPEPQPKTAPPETQQPEPQPQTAPPETPQPETAPIETPQPEPQPKTAPPETQQPEPQPQTAPPETSPQPDTAPPQPSPQPETAPPQTAPPKRRGRSRPLGFRSKKSAKKKVVEASKEPTFSLRRSARHMRSTDRVETSSEEDRSGDDESEDDDYIQSGSEPGDDDADLGDFIEDEDEVECLYDDIHEKQFEDYLDGSSTMDKTYKNGKVWTYQEFGAIKLQPWLIFADRESFIDVFKDYCVQEGFGVFVEKSDKQRYIARCAIDSCNWRLHASTMVDKVSWAIKTMTGEHTTCGRLENNPVVSSDWLCRHLLPDIQANPDIAVESLKRTCMERFRIQVKTRLFYKVKCMAKEIIHGGFGEAYSLLPRYAEMVKQTNPGSYALVTWTQGSGNVAPRFKACFFSFAAQVRGFLKGCRPIIGIDGAHLSGYYKGILLTAVGLDGNNEIVLIAYGIVDTESIDTWGYFMRNLKCVFEKEACNRDDWTFISDRMKGVDAAVHETFPRATRRICCQHLYMNCKNNGFSGTAFHKLFWIAADAYNAYVFNKAMEKIHDYNPKAVEYLENCTEVWSRHQFDTALCCDHNTTNFVESFNSCTKPFRDLPVLKLLEAIREWCMKRMAPRFDNATSMGDMELTEYATKILQTRSDESRFCYATPCGGDEFEVRDQHVHFPIKLGTGTCGCGKWQHSGIPCKHVLRVIYHQRLQPEEFVSPYFKGRAYKNTYAEHMHPMPDKSQWPSFSLPNILPPLVKRSAGRPKKQRRRGANEARKGKRHSTVKCSLCNELGHNKLTCAATKRNAATEASTSKTKKRAKKAA